VCQRAGRLDAVRGGREDVNGVGAEERLLDGRYPNAHPLAGTRMADEDHPPAAIPSFNPGDTMPTVGDAFDVDFELLVDHRMILLTRNVGQK
jgi:hypothetical protein